MICHECNWERTGPKVMQRGDQCVIKFPWSFGNRYVLWNGDEHAGTFDSAEEAQSAADNLMANKGE